MSEMKTLLGLGILGVGGYYLAKQMGWLPASISSLLPTTAPAPATTSAAPPAPSSVAAQGLTAADAAQYPYSGTVTSDQMNSISQTLMPQLKAGQIPTIGGGSVLAYMLGWGGLPAGTSKTVSGETYVYDGSNWNLQPAMAATAPATPSLPALSAALQKAAGANSFTVSQWNWFLTNRVNPGAPDLMTGPANPIDAATYVGLINQDPTYDRSSIKTYGLSGHRTMTRARRMNYVRNPALQARY